MKEVGAVYLDNGRCTFTVWAPSKKSVKLHLVQPVDQLLEMLSLQAEMMELRAETNVPAHGYILESSLEKGRGPVATVITQNGILKVGDYFSCGKTVGHVSSLVDSFGQRIKEALPSIPVQVAGFDERPDLEYGLCRDAAGAE